MGHDGQTDFRPVRGELALRDCDPSDTGGLDKHKARDRLKQDVKSLAKLHDLLYATRRKALLVILQGMDTSGKDGTIRHVLKGLSPQGTVVTSFKQPTAEERGHDFLWRVHRRVPERGQIGIFNRSQYEDVLIVRVHKEITPQRAKERLSAIRHFERQLDEEDVVIRKFFLHISPDEQARRIRKRLEDPAKRWKYSPDDLKERALWQDYMDAYEEAIRGTSTPRAPWYVVPSDHKWYRNYFVARVLVAALESLGLTWPDPAVPEPDSLQI